LIPEGMKEKDLIDLREKLRLIIDFLSTSA
jgi:hypothetical protein